MNQNKFILSIVMVVLLMSPINAFSAVIKGTKVVKTGTPVFNAMRLYDNVVTSSTSRPAVVRVTFSCDKTPNMLSSMDIETSQNLDKWGEWVVDNYDNDLLKDKIIKRCGEETPQEKAERIRIMEKEKEKERAEKAEKIRVMEMEKEQERAEKAEKIRIQEQEKVDRELREKQNKAFIIITDGTLDTRTNLMWAAKDNGRDINWANAKSYAENYRGGGYSDWRMPTQDELAGLYDSSVKNHNGNYLTSLITLTGCCAWASGGKLTWGGQVSHAEHFRFDNGQRVLEDPSKERGLRAFPVRATGERAEKEKQAKAAREKEIAEMKERLWKEEIEKAKQE